MTWCLQDADRLLELGTMGRKGGRVFELDAGGLLGATALNERLFEHHYFLRDRIPEHNEAFGRRNLTSYGIRRGGMMNKFQVGCLSGLPPVF